jgi:hypothetical protein
MRITSIPKGLLLICALTLITGISLAQQNITAAELVQRYSKSLELSPTGDNYFISDSYKDNNTGITYVYVQQQYKGIKVSNVIRTLAFKDNRLQYASGTFISDMASKAGSEVPALNAISAVSRTAAHLQLPAPLGLQVINDQLNSEKKIELNTGSIAKQNIIASLCWVSNDNGNTVRLSWNVNIDVLGKPDWWNVQVDAMNGNILGKDNWTVKEAADHLPKKKFISGDCGTNISFLSPLPPPNVTDATYNVVPFPNENPNVGGFAIETNPWLKAGATNNAVTNGWHFDGTNNYNITRGNNVHAYLDVSNTNAPSAANFSATSTTAAPTLTFNFTPDFTQFSGVTVNKNVALTNLFYWNNIIHDVLYQYGFNEVGGNFQNDNLSRGGQGLDYVQAEAQDGGGTNNANFATPSDGSKPRMQMYLWDGAPTMTVNSPAAVAGSYYAVEGNISGSNLLSGTGPVTGQLVYYNDDAAGTTHEACVAASNLLFNKIALINRGTCAFTTKVLNAQNAGAIAVIVVNNVPGNPITMGGTQNNAITIPAVMISQSDGALLAAQLANNVNVTLSFQQDFDGDLDNGIVTHEFGHGVSNRFTGGPSNTSCLSNAEQAGEGWSDYIALMLTTKWSATTLADSTKPRPVGTYAIGQGVNGSGIRRYPYCTDKNINPLTYSNMNGTFAGSESHNIGEIWCTALWDMTWNIIKQQGSITPDIYNANGTGGNVIALKLVMEGMKLQPCQPGFIDARNAILAADSILYNNAHKCAIWKAFAGRGMGYSANQGSSNSTSDQTVAFDIPSNVLLSKDVTPVVVANGTSYTINLKATCSCAAPLSNYSIVDTIPAGFSYTSSTGGSANGNVVTFSGIGFNNVNETKTFSLTITGAAAGCAIDSMINDNREINTVGGLTSSTVLAAHNWTESSTYAHSGNKSWYGMAAADSSEFILTSNTFTPQNLSLLSFWHRWDFEAGYDGGRLEMSPNGGTTWVDANPYIMQRPYNTIQAATPWGAGQSVYSGSSSNQFVNTIVNLTPFNGQSVKIRFRIKTDVGNPAAFDGWYIDDIIAMRGCGNFSKAILLNGSGTKVDSSIIPLYLTPAIVTGINEPNEQEATLKLFPNPTKGNATLHFNIREKYKTSISVFDLSGRKLLNYERGILLPGNYSQQIASKALPAGTYLIHIESGNYKAYKKLVVTQ